MATNPNLVDQVETIQSRDDLVAFLRDLATDLRTRPADWENRDLGNYLESAASWAEDMDGFFQNRGESSPERPDWKLLGMILLAAKSYE